MKVTYNGNTRYLSTDGSLLTLGDCSFVASLQSSGNVAVDKSLEEGDFLLRQVKKNPLTKW